MKQLSGIYTGPIKVLQNHKALLRRDGTNNVLAQFTPLHLPHNYTHGWTSFDRKDFVIVDDDNDLQGVKL